MADDGIQRETDADSLLRIEPELEKIEKYRQEKLAVYVARRGVGIVASIVGTPVTLFLDYLLIQWQAHSRNTVAGLTAVYLAALWGWVTQPRRDYARFYKEDVTPRIAKMLGLSTYQVDGGIPLAEMLPSKILPAHDEYKTEDYFEGVYKGARVRFSQATFKRRENDGKHTHYVTVFQGLVLMITMPRPKFYGQTLLVADQGRFGGWLEEKGTGLQRADMVDPVFEKKYDVFTSDQVEARYLVDPAMIERINNLAHIYYSDSISMSYYRDAVLALIRCTKDFFEPMPLEVPATNTGAVLEIKKELERTLELIDYLDVYTPAAPQAAGSA